MKHWFRLLLALVLTLLVTQHGVRYEALSQFSPSPWTADVRLHSQPTLSALDSAPSAWRLEATDSKEHRGLSWHFAVPPGAQAVRVQARVDIADVTQGERHWERASVALRQVGGQAKPRERSVFGETGTLSRQVDEVHLLLPGAESVQLLVRLLRASGSMEVHDLQLGFVAERSGMGWVVVGVWLVCGWCGLGALPAWAGPGCAGFKTAGCRPWGRHWCCRR